MADTMVSSVETDPFYKLVPGVACVVFTLYDRTRLTDSAQNCDNRVLRHGGLNGDVLGDQVLL